MKPTWITLCMCTLCLWCGCRQPQPPVLGQLRVDEASAHSITCSAPVSGDDISSSYVSVSTSRKEVENDKAETVAGELRKGRMTAVIENLNANSKYYIKAKVMSPHGMAESNIVVMKTAMMIPGEGDINYPQPKED